MAKPSLKASVRSEPQSADLSPAEDAFPSKSPLSFPRGLPPLLSAPALGAALLLLSLDGLLPLGLLAPEVGNGGQLASVKAGTAGLSSPIPRWLASRVPWSLDRFALGTFLTLRSWELAPRLLPSFGCPLSSQSSCL